MTPQHAHKPSRPYGRLLLLAVLIASIAGWSLIQGYGMNETIMMRTSFDEPLFDATPWFVNDMYQRSSIEDPALFPGLKYSQNFMQRVSPSPFTDDQVLLLRIRIHRADPIGANFRPAVPASVKSLGIDSDFDPRPQIIYTSSGFFRGHDAPGKPIDYYMFYTLLDGQRFFVSITRDGETGEILLASRQFSSSIPKDEEESRFQTLQSQAELQSRLDAPGWKVRSGEPCPWPGTWECPEIPVGKQTFAHAILFPRINGQDVTWRFVPPAR